MSVLMIKSNLGNVIDIEGNSTNAGANLDAYTPKVDAPSLGTGGKPVSANQAWEILPDPAGSSFYIIKNPATGHCIDIKEASQNAGAALDAWTEKKSKNENQLWCFLPDPFGSGSYFIQNPQTGYVIEIANGSTAAGALLVVNHRRIFGNNHQLWSGVDGVSFTATGFPGLTLAASPTGALTNFGSNNQYVLLTANQSTNITSFVVTLDIIEDLVTPSFSVQINGNAPTPSNGTGAKFKAQWVQYGLVMQNNSLALWNQAWHADGPDPKGNPLASVDETSSSMLQIQNNTIPAGTRIVLTLTIDPKSNDYVTAVVGQVYNGSGAPIGKQVTWSLIGQPTFNPGGPVQEVDLAPFGAVSVVIAGPPGGNTNFSSGMGTITVTCEPSLTVSPQLNGPNPHGIQTAEQSNCYYSQVQQGAFKKIVQPFGVPAPKITGVGGPVYVGGTGLFPHASYTAKASYAGNYGTIAATIDARPAAAAADGSFSFEVVPQNLIANTQLGTLSVNVTDSQGNTAWHNISVTTSGMVLTPNSGGGTPGGNF